MDSINEQPKKWILNKKYDSKTTIYIEILNNWALTLLF